MGEGASPDSRHPLFNGRDLSGWKFIGGDGNDWVVDGGALVNTAGRGWLVTEAEYDDFELRLESRISERGNSGVLIGGALADDLAVAGTEIQFLDDVGCPGLRPDSRSVCSRSPFRPSDSVRPKPNHLPATEWRCLQVSVPRFVPRPNRSLIMLRRIVCLSLLFVGHTAGVYGQTATTGRQARSSPTSTVEEALSPLKIGPVWVLSMSATKDLVLTGGGDGSLVLWDIDSIHLASKPNRVLRKGRRDETGNPVIFSRDDAIRAAGFSPDGNVLAASLQRGIEIRDLSAPDLIVRTLAHSAEVTTLAFSRDGQHLASGDTQGNLRIWDVRSGELLKACPNSDQSLLAVAFDPDGKHLAGVCKDGKTTLWSWAEPKTVFSVQTSGNADRCAAEYSANGRWLAVARMADAKNSGVCVLDGRTGESRTLFGGGHTVLGAAFTPDGSKLIGLLGNNTLLVWNSGDWAVQSIPLTSSKIRLGFNGLSLTHRGLLGLSGFEAATFHGHLEIKGFAAGRAPEAKKRALGLDKNRVSSVELAAVVEGHNQFAWEAYARLRERTGNIAFSPFSLASGLAMVQAGARGQTAEQIAKVLHLPSDSASVHRALGLLHRGVVAGEAGPRGVKLTSANSLWAGKSLSVLPEYLAMIQEQYQSTVNEALFEDNPESARRAINAWVKSQTDGRIPELLKPGAISNATQLVLANALTFQGTWASAFKKELTQSRPFRVSSRRQIQVPLMQQTGKFRLATTAWAQALELPYTGRDVALVLLLPRHPDGIAELEKHLTSTSLSEWLRQFKPETVTVSLPRFAIAADWELTDLLAQLGMPLAFQRDGADFSGLCSAEQPFALSSVAQHVRIVVDEAGTEAHAATALRASRGLPNPEVHEFTADRPFVFFLRDLRTGKILFLGRLAEPGTSPNEEK